MSHLVLRDYPDTVRCHFHIHNCLQTLASADYTERVEENHNSTLRSSQLDM